MVDSCETTTWIRSTFSSASPYLQLLQSPILLLLPYLLKQRILTDNELPKTRPQHFRPLSDSSPKTPKQPTSVPQYRWGSSTTTLTSTRLASRESLIHHISDIGPPFLASKSSQSLSHRIPSLNDVSRPEVLTPPPPHSSTWHHPLPRVGQWPMPLVRQPSLLRPQCALRPFRRPWRDESVRQRGLVFGVLECL